MFRNSNPRGKKRLSTFYDFSGTKNGKLVLSQSQIQLIERTPIISLGEKIELFLVALGNKLTTELYITINYTWNDKKQEEIPDQKKLKEIKRLLEQLPFIYFQDSLPMKNRQNSNMQHFIWFQVSINETVSHFMKDFPDDLTEFEEGVLYGFPLSAIRAFSGLIKPTYEKPNAASHWLAGVMSADFWDDEQIYYQMWWERLRQLSPKIVEEAEDQFQKQT